MKRLIAPLMAVTLTLGSFAGAATYKNPTKGVEFDYDDSQWEIVPNGGNARPLEAVDKTMAERTLVTVQRKLADDKYRARFSVVVDPAEKFTGNESERLVAYQKHAVDFLTGQRFHILSTQKTTLPNVKSPAVEIMANQRDFGLMFRQVAVLVGKEAYLLTAAARTKKFPDYQAEIAKMFSSFKLAPVTP